jgi:hypothetical protein
MHAFWLSFVIAGALLALAGILIEFVWFPAAMAWNEFMFQTAMVMIMNEDTPPHIMAEHTADYTLRGAIYKPWHWRRCYLKYGGYLK